MRFTFRPLTWLGPRTDPDRRRSRYTFKARWEQTLALLEQEIEYLGADAALLFADFTSADIVKDGSMPRANARQPAFPGVKVTFQSVHGELTYETDVCEFWQHNVRSIALGLKSLRMVDLYGIQQGRQYQGYLAIEAARPMGAAPAKPPKFATPEAAMSFLQSEQVTGIVGADGLTPRMVWHLAVTRHHPDKVGESDLWDDVLLAKQVVEKAGLL